MDEIERLKSELDKMHCINAELRSKIQQYEEGNFQMVSREKAVLEVLQNPKAKVYQIDISEDYVGYIGDIQVCELKDDQETFYVIQKGYGDKK